MLQAENTLFTIVMLLYFAAMILYFVFIAVKRDALSRMAVLLQAAGFVRHTAALSCRGVGAGRLPLTNQYEFATCFAWGLCLVSLIFILRFRFPVLGAFAAPVIFLMIGYAAMQSKEVKELMPALRSNWLGFHVSTAIIAYGSFGVSFVLSVIFLLRDRIRADQLQKRSARSSVSHFYHRYRSHLGRTCLGELLVLGSERDLVARDLDHLCHLSASPDSPQLGREICGNLCSNRFYLRDVYLCRGKYFSTWCTQLRLTGSIFILKQNRPATLFRSLQV